MSGMQQVEATVGEGDLQPLVAPVPDQQRYAVERVDFPRVCALGVGRQGGDDLAGGDRRRAALAYDDAGRAVGDGRGVDDFAATGYAERERCHHRVARPGYVEHLPGDGGQVNG